MTPPTVWAMAPITNVARVPPGTAFEARETIAEAAITPEHTVVVIPVPMAIRVAALVILLIAYGIDSDSGDAVLPSTSFEPADSSGEPVTCWVTFSPC